jgi:hypothetical protein
VPSKSGVLVCEMDQITVWLLCVVSNTTCEGVNQVLSFPQNGLLPLLSCCYFGWP